MARLYPALNEAHRAFIAQQQLFFVATAAPKGRINISPKGGDCLRVLGADRLIWLNLTGSGNETAAHLHTDPRMTLMFCAFEGDPLILRLYGQAHPIQPGDSDWPGLYSRFPPDPGARQVIDMRIEQVQTSCGFGVPLFDYRGERSLLRDWSENKGPDGIRDYWAKKNRTSLDGLPTGVPVDKTES